MPKKNGRLISTGKMFNFQTLLNAVSLLNAINKGNGRILINCVRKRTTNGMIGDE